jgi:hypothetical protein
VSIMHNPLQLGSLNGLSSSHGSNAFKCARHVGQVMSLHQRRTTMQIAAALLHPAFKNIVQSLRQRSGINLSSTEIGVTRTSYIWFESLLNFGSILGQSSVYKEKSLLVFGKFTWLAIVRVLLWAWLGKVYMVR